MTNNFLTELKDFLNNTSKEDVLKKWSESVINSDAEILVEEYIGDHYSYNFNSAPPSEGKEWITNSFKNLEETSGFCFL